MITSKQKKIMKRLLAEKTIMCDTYDDYCVALAALCAGFEEAEELGMVSIYLKILFHDYCVLVAQGEIELYRDNTSDKKRKEFKRMVQDNFSMLKIRAAIDGDVPTKEGEDGKITFDVKEITKRLMRRGHE